MTRERAHLILEATRRGWPIPDPVITEALEATGDLVEFDFLRVVRSTWEPIEVPQQVWFPA